MQRTAATGHVSNKFNDRAGLTPGTIVEQKFLNTIQEELCHLAELGPDLLPPGTAEDASTYRDNQIQSLISSLLASSWRSWTMNGQGRQSSTIESQKDIAHDDEGNIVIVRAGSGTDTIITSNNWGLIYIPTVDDTAIGMRYFYAVDCKRPGGTFCACAGSGGSTNQDKIVRSINGGQSWSNVGISGAGEWYDICTDNYGNWVCVGGSGSTNIVYSTDDGASWQAATTSAVHTSTFDFGAVIYANGLFMAGGYNTATSSPIVYWSADGNNWTAATSPPFCDRNIESLAYRPPIGGQTDGEWIAGMGAAGSTDNFIHRSTDDGDTWNAHSLPIDSSGNDEKLIAHFTVCYDNVFYMGGQLQAGLTGDIPAMLKFSEIGRYSWVTVPSESDLIILGGMCQVRGGFVAVGASATSGNFDYILQSANLL